MAFSQLEDDYSIVNIDTLTKDLFTSGLKIWDLEGHCQGKKVCNGAIVSINRVSVDELEHGLDTHQISISDFQTLTQRGTLDDSVENF